MGGTAGQKDFSVLVHIACDSPTLQQALKAPAPVGNQTLKPRQDSKASRQTYLVQMTRKWLVKTVIGRPNEDRAGRLGLTVPTRLLVLPAAASSPELTAAM